MQFERYAKLYDVINNDKDYEAEANYFMDLAVFGNNKYALEIGSGTGQNSEFFQKKLKLVCVEKSRDMAILARNRVVSNVIEGDFTTVEIPEQKFLMWSFAYFMYSTTLQKMKILKSFSPKFHNVLSQMANLFVTFGIHLPYIASGLLLEFFGKNLMVWSSGESQFQLWT